MNRILPFFLLISLCLPLFAQQHAYPADKSLGIPGQQARSFLIGWHPVPGAAAYEYVLTDNFLCFAGCVGDTRQTMVTDTFAIEFELLPDRQYYWITRVHFEDGETGPWSLISEFWSWTPPVEPVAQIAPNPVNGPASLRLDWGAYPEADIISVEVIDINGQPVFGPVDLLPESYGRMEERSWEVGNLPGGLYFLKAEPRTRDGRRFLPTIQKVQVW